MVRNKKRQQKPPAKKKKVYICSECGNVTAKGVPTKCSKCEGTAFEVTEEVTEVRREKKEPPRSKSNLQRQRFAVLRADPNIIKIVVGVIAVLILGAIVFFVASGTPKTTTDVEKSAFSFEELSGGPQQDVSERPSLFRLDTSFYKALFDQMEGATKATQIIITLSFLIMISTALDALSNLTGRNWDSVVGQILLLVAFVLPSPLMKAVLVFVACWTMSRDKDSRQKEQAWIILLGVVAVFIYVVGNTYLTWSTTGVMGVLRVIAHVLFTLEGLGAAVLTYLIVLFFTYWGFNPRRDGSGQAWLHILLGSLALLGGRIPLTNMTGGQEFLSWQALQNPVFIFSTVNFVIASALFVKEQNRMAEARNVKSELRFVGPLATLIVVLNVAFVAHLGQKAYGWKPILAMLAGFVCTSIPFGVFVLFAGPIGGESFKRGLTDMVNKILGDHTSVGPVLIFNDMFSLVATLIIIGVSTSEVVARFFVL